MDRKDIDNLEIYNLGMQVGEMVYNLVFSWDSFQKNTIGFQLVRSSDSISANISEGYGRYHVKEQRRFCYIARGSLYETHNWLSKAITRSPKDQESINCLLTLLHTLLKRLIAYIKYIEREIKKNT